ncbi:MAG: hypothetical protein DRJ21_01765 [Candidatus Methanomethylicota archaeon]|uniref:RING-type domain-containing protein n=1 Tax=Thermoproteota archaeon TaxID=2056631 RepID=A0A497ESM9_9CREN|nr:MAG: hypothetical protein DRJ21_01765 [Candidatus Verstraetearchaeota archaeon]
MFMAFVIGRCLRCGRKVYKDDDAYKCEHCGIYICEICYRKLRGICPLCKRELVEISFPPATPYLTY